MGLSCFSHCSLSNTGPNHPRWQRGPEFLYKDERDWPEQEKNWVTSEEMRIVNLHHRTGTEEIFKFERFSKWECLLRTAAEELLEAELTVVRLIQRESFANEYATLVFNQQVPMEQRKLIDKNSKLYKLCPFLGGDGLIRKDGRIDAAPWLSYEAKFPAILPKNHYVTTLIIHNHHRKFGHANNETVVNELRQRFHVSEIRSAVRKMSDNCRKCKVPKASPHPPRMGPLPESRLNPYVRPFTFTGLDYFGPISIRLGRSCVKRWVALFTCLTTRAIHLELAFTLATESCKLAVRRFIARRGAPLEIYSDQGTNFQGARKELQQETNKLNHELAATFTDAATQWKLNPPYAPHMGGIWERLVRSVKAALAAMEMSRNPDEETLITALAEAESLINSRPLTYLPLDTEENEALTPNHFLLLSSNGVCQPVTMQSHNTSAIRSNWKHVQVMLDRFWSRWIKEFLPIISRQSKWFGEVKPIHIGDLVMIVNEMRRNSWERGRVVKLYPGKDGRIRSADVKTSTGIVQRPLTKLAVLDVGIQSIYLIHNSNSSGVQS
ncbi:uncharacterized protein LOC129761081 [Toxorhynchites rutilus septentrionalis]|uniref:uncharacterized protein LOC129761081 n=1 Tax=Toxorhynchites rutilus septentrionalis TaxID=329112 RepID=UPI0024793F2E|nr:uncharacterized protein LOC129761081 [Toxorhynchites rutilus septentrionalis]